MNKVLTHDRSLLIGVSKTAKPVATQVDQEIKTLLQAYVQNVSHKVLISVPTFKRNGGKVEIGMYYFQGDNNDFPKNVFNSKILELGNRYYSANVVVNLTQVHYPYINASIFSQYLFYNSSANTFMHFQNAVQKYFSWHGKDIIAHINGVKIEVSGRIMTEKVIPRVTKKSMVFGSLSNSDFIDFSQHTDKNFIGTITVKV